VRQNAKLIDKLRNAGTIPPAEFEEAKKRAEIAERKLQNRSNYLLAKAKEYLKNHSISDEERKDFEKFRRIEFDYDTLLASVRASERLDRKEYVTRWRILTKAIVATHQKSESYALFAKSNGSYVLEPWKAFSAFTGNPHSDDYDQTPFTHYMTIPKTNLRYLLGLGDNQNAESPDPQVALPNPELCEGCPHHVTDPNNPNSCVLPDCIHNYEKPIGPSSNNTNL